MKRERDTDFEEEGVSTVYPDVIQIKRTYPVDDSGAILLLDSDSDCTSPAPASPIMNSHTPIALSDSEEATSPHRVGKLMRVRMKNIRSHKNFDLRIGDCTIITGANGSGKSTIALGVQLALGKTMRKEKAADADNPVVRSGCTDAEVHVTFWNEGPGAYEYAEFGRDITITRKIKMTEKSVTNTYIITGATGRVLQGTAAKNVKKAICSLWNLDESNPVLVLDQETAKSFLTCDPRKQYDYFLRATTLKSTYDEMAKAAENASKAKECLDVLEKDLKAAKNKYEKAKKKMEQFRGVTQLQEEIEEAENNRSWSIAAEKKREVLVSYNAVETHENLCQRMAHVIEVEMQENIEALQKKIEQLREEREKIRDSLESSRNELLALTTAQEVLLDELNSQKVSSQKQESLIREMTTQISQIEVAYRRTQAEIDHKKQQTELRAAEDNERRIREALEAVIRNHQDAEDKLAQFERQYSYEGKQAEYRIEDERLKQLLEDRRKLDAQFRQLQRSYQQERNSEPMDPMELISRSGIPRLQATVNVHKLVQNNRNLFSQPPIGPVGAYVRIKKSQWAKAVSMYCSILDHFLVDNARDANAFRDLCLRYRIEIPKFIVRKFTTPLPNPQKIEGRETLRDILEFSNSSVELAVMEDTSMHQVVLSDNKAGAEAQIAHEKDAQGRPISMIKGAKCAITRDSHHEVSINPNGIVYKSFFRPQQAGLVPLSSAETISNEEMYQQLMREAQQNLSDVARRVQEQEVVVNAKSRELTQIKRQLDSLKDASQKFVRTRVEREKQLEEVTQVLIAAQEQARLNANTQEEEAQLYTLEASLELTRSQLEERKRVAEELRMKCAETERKCREKSREIERLSKSISDNPALHRCDAEIQEIERKRQAVNVERSAMQSELSKEQQLLERARLTVQQKEAEYNTAVERAREITGRAEAPEGTPDRVVVADGKIKALHAQLVSAEQTLQRQGLDFDAVQKEYLETKKNCDRLNRDFSHLSEEVERLLRQQDNIRELYLSKREKAVEDVTAEFKRRMSEKGHLASLQIIHGSDENVQRVAGHRRPLREDQGEIAMYILPSAFTRGTGRLNVVKHGQNVAMLSGGEKSYTSLLLLSAISRVSDLPFRIIDEFDVFQDDHTRKLSMQFLLEDSKEIGTSGYLTQHILITPQDISNSVPDLEQDSHVSIVHMRKDEDVRVA